ncbi:MAG TPA: YpdA family putative bacillithiol disulfide reductase [Candidatus Acidoferrales bacterium]|nr:YpdA family putative bacillithiol disulfide reductase [Candidatus Acidoferrales bacterium]
MKYDVVVIGAGPAGLSAAIEAKGKNFSVLVLDKGAIVNSIQNFPTNMTFFSTAELLEIGGIPFVAGSPHPTRVEAVNYYSRTAKFFGIEFRFSSRVISICRSRDDSACFTIEIKNEISSQLNFISADRIIVATGFYDNPNMLNVPGENLPSVSHYYKEPGIHFGEKVIVIGGNNSAVEAALDLHRHDVNVTLIHRREWFGKGVKYWVLPDIENRIKSGVISAYFNSRVAEIKPDKIIIEQDGTRHEIASDFVYVLTGYHPAVNFLREVGIEVDEKTGVPNHDPSTFESNVKGIFVAGSIVAGYDCNKIFIENGREHGKVIARSLMK